MNPEQELKRAAMKAVGDAAWKKMESGGQVSAGHLNKAYRSVVNQNKDLFRSVSAQEEQAIKDFTVENAKQQNRERQEMMKPAAQKRDEAKALYDSYVQSDEYRQNLDAAAKAQTDAWMQAALGGNVQPMVPAGDQKEQELRAMVEHYEAQAQKEADQATLDEALRELSGWSEEERKALEAYGVQRDWEAINPMADPVTGGSRQVAGTVAKDLIAKYGEAKVNRMAEALKWKYGAEAAQALTEKGQAEAGDGLLKGIGADVKSIGAKGLSNLTGLMGYIQELGQRTGQFSTLNPYNAGMLPGTYGDAVQSRKAENLAADGGKLDAYLYQGGMSAADSALRMAMGGGAAGGAVLSATGSFARTVSEASAKGASPAEAAALGTVNAGIEYLTEKLPLDNLMKAAKTGGHTWKEVARGILIQGGIEATEEEISLIGTTLAEAAILKEKGGNQQRFNELIAQGMDPEAAQRTVTEELLQEAKETAIVSFLSGGMSEAGASLAGNLTHRGKNTDADGKHMHATADEAEAVTEQAQPKTEQEKASDSVMEAAEQMGKEAPKAEPVRKTEGELRVDQAYEATAGAEQKVADNGSSVKEQLRSSQEQLNTMEPVASIQTPKNFADMTKTERKSWVIEKLRSTNYKVDRKGFGVIKFAEKQLKSAFNYLSRGSAEEASFEAVPYVLEHGSEISGHDVHKGREYGTVTFAAPVIINGKRGNMAVVVKRTTDNFYKVHRILTPEGTVFNLSDMTNEAEPSLAGESPETGSLATPISSASENIVPQQKEDVNGNVDESSAQKADNQEKPAEAGIRGTGAAEANFSGMRQYEDMISDDNIQRSRATDARQEEILKTDPYGRQVTEFAGNVGNSEAISDRDVDTLKQMIQDGLLGHDTQRMSDVHKTAVEKIKKKGAAEVRDEITRAVASGKINEHLIAEAEVLFAQYSNRKNMQADASTMLLNLAQMATQSGRQLNMFRLMRMLTPEGQLMTVKKNVDRAVEKINETRGGRKQAEVTISEELETAYTDAARDAASDEAAVESTVALTIAEGMQEDTLRAADTALAKWEKDGAPDIPWGEIRRDSPRRSEANVQRNDMNERVGQRVADNLTRQARQQERAVEDVLYSEIMRFANDKAAAGRQNQAEASQTPNLESMRDYYRYRPFFQNAWDIARNRVEQAMFSMQDGDPRISVIEQFLASGDELLGVENWTPIGAADYANPKSTVRRGAKEAADAAGIRMDNRSTRSREVVRQQMRDVLIENSQNKETAARRIAEVAVESMGLEGQAAEAMASDVVRAFYNDLAQQSARRVAKMFGTDRNQRQKVQKTMSQRLAELYNMGAFSDEQYRQAAFDSIFGEGSGIKIDDRLLETFVNAAGERRDQAAEAIYKSAAAQIKPTLGEMWDAWRNMSMLLNPKTHIRNFLGSGAFRPYAEAKRAIGAGVERLTLDQKNRTKAVLGFSEDSRALLNWAKEDAKTKAAKDAMELSGTTGNDVRSAVEDARQILPGKMDTARKKNMELMEAEDMIFKRVEYARSLASFLKARGFDSQAVQEGRVPADVMAEGRSIAAREAQKATFNDRNRFSDAMANFRVKGSNPAAKALNVMAKGIMPFTRTPANIAVRAVEYSPAGLVKGFSQIHDAVKHGEGTVADGIDSIASGLTGCGAMALGAALAAGLIPGVRLVGKIEDEDEKREGAQEYSIQLGGEYYGISWLAPANMPLFIGANLYNEWNGVESGEDADAWDKILALVETVPDIIDPMLELSCVSSLADAVKTMSYEESMGDMALSMVASAATSYFTQGLPTILGQAEQATEKAKTTVYSNAESPVQRAIERTLGNATKRIPGVDLYQTDKLDEFGNVVENKGGPALRAFNAFLNPFNQSSAKNDALTKEISRLHDVQPDKVAPPDTPKTISYTDTDGTVHDQHRLTEAEYSTLAKVQGQTAKDLLEAILESDTYAAMTDEQKASVFRYVYDYAREKGRTEALPGYEGMDGWMKDIQGREADGILDKAVKAAFTDAFDQLEADPDTAAEALDRAYELVPPAERPAMAKDAGGRTKYFIDAKRMGVDTGRFLELYQTFREIDENPDLNTSDKAAEWSYQLEKAQEAGILTKAQKDCLKDSMVYYQMFPAETAKFDQMTEAGISADKAMDIGQLLKGIKPQKGYTSVRDVQEAEALAGSSLSRSEKTAVMKIYLSDAQDENLDQMLSAGYTPEDYAAVYKIYDSEKGTGKKARTIARIREEMGVDDATARKIYEIYG